MENLAEIRGAVVDLDGTIYRGSELIPGADAAVEALRDAGVEVLFLSNKPIKRREAYRELLASLGIDVARDRIVNSSAITADHLAAEHPDAPVLVVGEQPLVDELEAAGLTVTDYPEAAAVVVASMDREFDYGTLTRAMRALKPGVKFYATNPDRTCPVESGEVPDAGGMIGAIEGVTGRSLDRVLGKPSTVTVDVALSRLDIDPERCLIVGDRLETDIRMGIGAGMRTALVLSGVTDRDDLAASSLEPDRVLDSIAEIRTRQ
jgi:arabinose operon protein AraL